MEGMYNQNKGNKVTKCVKEMLTSPLFLTGAIAYSVYGLFELLSGMTGGNSGISSLMNRLPEMRNMYGLDYSAVQMYISGYNTARVAVALLASIPAMIIIAGLWMMFASGKSKTGRSVNVTGLTMIRVIVIIRLVGACIALAFVEIVCISALVIIGGEAGSYDGGYFILLLILAMIIVAVVYALQIIFYIKLSSVILSVKSVAVTGKPDAEVSRYVEIFCYLAGGAAALSALMSLVRAAVLGFLANAGLATAYIVFAIFLMKYRTNMQMLQQNPGMMIDPAQALYQPPVQEQPSYQPSYQPQEQPAYQSSVQEPLQRSYQPSYRSQEQSYNRENETTVLPYYNETSVLSGQFVSGGQMQLVRMTRQKTGETFCISKPSFWIGKDPANVDYCISDNSAVSRRHVLVTIQNGSCYVRDNHSTNRVYINGQVIMPDTDTLVSNGDRVRLGDEEFVVSIG